MRLAGLVRAGLRQNRRTYAGVLLGCAVATATLTGALAVGDSVRFTLASQAEGRIGRVDRALIAGDRFFREELVTALDDRAGTQGAPVISLPAIAATPDGAQRVRDVSLLGVDERFFALAPDGAGPAPPPKGGALLSERLARALDVEPGDPLVLRLEKPSSIPRDMALAPEDVSFALRLEVTGLVGRGAFGEFALETGAEPSANLFVALDELAAELDVEGRANLALFHVPAPATDLTGPLREVWTIADAELALETLPDGRRELISDRIFFDDPVVAALASSPALEGVGVGAVFTYFVNELRHGERATPYSMVSGLGPLRAPLARRSELDWPELAPAQPDGIILNEWEAADLGAAVGDDVELAFFVVDASSRLVERRRTFLVEAVVPLSGLAAERELMPAFPGLAEADNCRDWEPGTPVDLDRIRDVDEVYWDDHGGTPKAFVSLAAARDMWASRFGSLTGVRFEAGDEAAVRSALREGMDPAALGLVLRDLAAAARTAATSPTDFGGLFLGLSFFLIVAALLLLAQLFLLGIEARASEIGMLAAVGWPARRIARVFVCEGALVAFFGVLLGLPFGLLYTRLVIHGLTGVWSGAVARLELAYHATAGTVVLGLGVSWLVTTATLVVTSRRKVNEPPVRLLFSKGGVDALPARVNVRRSLFAAGLALAGAAVLGLSTDLSSGAKAAGAFFGAGALVLVAGLLLARLVLRRGSHGTDGVRSLARLGLENAKRMPGRSLATTALLAIGTFLVVAVGANRQGPVTNTHERASGTGGFAFFGRSSLAVVHDLNTAEGRAFYALPEGALMDVAVVPLRVREGDDASCLNLSAPRVPELYGVDPSALAERGAFAFASTETELAPGVSPWTLLDQPIEDDVVPAIGDAVSLTWQLKKGVGDTLEYTDERGRVFSVRIVAALSDSVLQGSLVIANRNFEARYPSLGGYRGFLIDAPPERADEVSATLTRALGDVGLALEASGERLDAFHSVQNTYLAIFQVLGALGLLLGSIGLGMVVLRNTLERRGELALTVALGFRPGRVRRLLFSEYGALLAGGLFIGASAAFFAILPALTSPGSSGSPATAALLVLAIGANGLFWIALASRAVDVRSPQRALSEE